MTTLSPVPVAPSTVHRPPWIGADVWERMPWSARMRAARRVLHVVRPAETDDGADPTQGGSGTSAPVATPAAPSSPDPEPTYPCAIGCGRWTPLVYCDPCAALHEVEPASPPPRWLKAAWSNRRTVDYLARVYGGHVQHPHRGGHSNAPRRYRPVTP